MNEPVAEGLVWLIFFLPVASFFAITVGLRHQPKLAALATIAAIGVAFAVSAYALIEVIGEEGHAVGYSTHELFSAGELIVNAGARLDGLSAVMLVVVTGISLLVQVYSLGYMKGDGGFARYYAYMSLFTAAMLGLILADNLLMLFVFWELVGAASYFLIGFWFHKPTAVAAAKKAFIVTRFGDLGLLAALILIWDRAGNIQHRRDQHGRHRARPSRHPQPDDAHPLRARPYRRCDRQERPVPTPHLAARRHGGPHPRLRPRPLRHHGRGRRLPPRPLLPRRSRLGLRLRLHRLDRGHHRPRRSPPGRRPDRHQTRSRLLHHFAARLHDVRHRRWRLRGCRFPPDDARLLQVAGSSSARDRSATPPTPSTCARWAASAR